VPSWLKRNMLPVTLFWPANITTLAQCNVHQRQAVRCFMTRIWFISVRNIMGQSAIVSCVCELILLLLLLFIYLFIVPSSSAVHKFNFTSAIYWPLVTNGNRQIQWEGHMFLTWLIYFLWKVSLDIRYPTH
jgi:hypothetical protein